jgi:hypothetical protein
MSAAPHKLTYADLHAMFWHRFVTKYERTGYTPRMPAESLGGLIPANGHGYCLAPVITNGARMWFDSSLEAEPGDIVLAEFHPTVIDRILRERADDAEFQQQYGDRAKRGELGRVIKLLAEYRGRRYLVTHDSLTPLDGGQFGAGPPLGPSKILGVLRNIGGSVDLLPGVQPPTPTEGLLSNAATEVLQIEDATTGSFSSDVGGESYGELLTANVTVEPGDVIDVAGSMRVVITLDGSATGYGGMRVLAAPHPSGSYVYGGALLTVDPADGSVLGSINGSFTGLSGTYRFGLAGYVNKTDGGSDFVHCTASQKTLVINRVKR